MRPHALVGRDSVHSQFLRAHAAADPYGLQAPPRAQLTEFRVWLPRLPIRSAPRQGRRHCCWRRLPRRATDPAPWSYRPWLFLSNEAPDHLGGVVHHRDDPGIVDSSRADHTDRADDLLAAVLVGGDYHRATGDTKEAVFGADEYLDTLALPARIEQTQHCLPGFEHFEQGTQPLEIGERGDIFEQIGLAAHDQRAALVTPGPVGKTRRHEL